MPIKTRKAETGSLRWSALLVVITVTVLTAVLWPKDHESTNTSVLNNSNQNTKQTDATPQTVESMTPASSGAKNDFDRGIEIDRLVASRSPEDAFKAFKIIHKCLRYRAVRIDYAQETDPEYKKLMEIKDPTDFCVGISPGQMTMRTRLLIQAGEAGVKGSFPAAADLSHRELKNDAELMEAIPRIKNSAINAGDPLALIDASFRYDNCEDPPKCTSRDPYKSLELSTAFYAIQKAEGKQPPSYPDVVTQKLIKEIGLERANAAIAAGNELAAKAIVKRQKG